MFTAVWNSSTSTFSLVNGSGTSSAPYIISSASDLAKLASEVNAGDIKAGVCYTLTSNIDLSTVCGSTGFDASGTYDGTSTNAKSWPGIGGATTKNTLTIASQDNLNTALGTYKLIYDNTGNSYTYGSSKNIAYNPSYSYYYLTGPYFAGSFDGDGHTISNLYVNTAVGYTGLFGNVKGTLSNFTVTGSVTSTASNADYIGGVTGMLSESGTISGVTANVTVTANNCFNVGGIAGFAGTPLSNTSAANTNITRCVNLGSITGYNKTGGIAGENAATISLCYNSGRVDATNTGSKNGVGGIAGRNGNNNTASEAGTIINCYNTAEIGRAGQKWVGGLTGFNNALSTVRNCYDFGKVNGTGQYNPIVGQNEGTTGNGTGVFNSYYLDTLKTADECGVYGGNVDTLTSKKTSDAMKTAAFVKALGSGFIADAATPINSGYPVLSWQSGRALYSVSVPTGDGFTITPATGYTTDVMSGGDFKFTVTASTGYTLNYVEATSRLTPVSGIYTVSNITGNTALSVNVTKATAGSGTGATTGGQPTAAVWDGETADIRWFTDNPSASTFTISYPAQLAGLAALVNGMYNSNIKYIYGDTSYIVDNQAIGTSGSNNNATPQFHYGSYDFDGKTVYLGADIDMGAGNNYMPVGGQYLMKSSDTTTRVDASFNGTFDGQGHNVTIYCDRWATDYGNGSSVGLFGRLGCHDSDIANGINTLPNAPAVRNVSVSGTVRANRSVGGIVGKIGKTVSGGTIENCANFTAVTGTDSKGTGGICGSAWNGGTIRNCYNAGAVTNTYKNAGGIAGSCEVAVVNCYNVGLVTSSANNDMAIATNNGGATFTNCWYLASTTTTGGVYSGSSADTSGSMTSENMKAAAFVKTLGSAFAVDTNSTNKGYPVLKWQAGGSTGGTGSTGSSTASATIDTKAETTGTQSKAEISDSAVAEAVSKAIADAKTGDGKAEIKINVTAPSTSTMVQASMPKSSFDAIATSEIVSLTIDTPVGSVSFDSGALDSISSQAQGADIKIGVSKVDTSTLTQEQKSAVGTATVIDLSLASGNTQIHNFGSGSAAVSVPYTLKSGESANGIVIWYLADDGTLTQVENAVYDSTSGTVKFAVTHFSNYVIAYDVVAAWKSPFTDIYKAAWYYKNVYNAYTKGLFAGTSGTTFAPNDSMTRAMFVTVLGRLAGVKTSDYTQSSFSDVQNGLWYSAYVQWASSSGIVTGENGLFNPSREMTREEMAVILYRYAKLKGYDLSGADSLASFSDATLLSSWSGDAVKWAVSAKLLNGMGNGTLAPKATVTRAQVAAILQRFSESTVK